MATSVISYRVPFAWLAPVVTIVMLAAGIAGMVASLVRPGPWPLLLLWLLGMGWLAFNVVLRLPYEVVVQDGALTWRGYARSRVVALSEVTQWVSTYAGSIQVLEVRSGGSLRIPVMQGYAPFVQAVADAYPEFAVSLGGYARLVERVQIRRRKGGGS